MVAGYSQCESGDAARACAHADRAAAPAAGWGRGCGPGATELVPAPSHGYLDGTVDPGRRPARQPNDLRHEPAPVTGSARSPDG